MLTLAPYRLDPFLLSPFDSVVTDFLARRRENIAAF